MKETLELNHIKGYLDHGLECEIFNYKCDYVGEQYGTVKGYYFLGDTIHYMFKDKSTAGKDASLFMPLLHPLSKLNEIIEHNGDSICVADIILRETLLNGSGANINTANNVVSLQIPYLTNKLIAINDQIVGECDYVIYETLCKYHFDIHGLIQKGLAKEK